jgi:hypothetical protein
MKSCDFKTTEASTKAWFRTNKIIDNFLNIIDLSKFRKEVTKFTDYAKEKYGVDKGRLFLEEGGGKKAVPNKEAFKAIDRAKGNYTLYGIADTNDPEAIKEATEAINAFLDKIGVQQDLVDRPENAPKSAIARANFIKGTIDIFQDARSEGINSPEKLAAFWKKVESKMPEEAAHWWFRLLRNETDLKQALWTAHQTEAKANALYKGRYGKLVSKAEDLKEEAIGQLIAEAANRIVTGKATNEDKTFLQKVFNWINSILNRFRDSNLEIELSELQSRLEYNKYTEDPFERAAIRILEKDITDLHSLNDYMNVVSKLEDDEVNKAVKLWKNSTNAGLVVEGGELGSTFNEDEDNDIFKGEDGRWYITDRDGNVRLDKAPPAKVKVGYSKDGVFYGVTLTFKVDESSSESRDANILEVEIDNEQSLRPGNLLATLEHLIPEVHSYTIGSKVELFELTTSNNIQKQLGALREILLKSDYQKEKEEIQKQLTNLYNQISANNSFVTILQRLHREGAFDSLPMKLDKANPYAKQEVIKTITQIYRDYIKKENIVYPYSNVVQDWLMRAKYFNREYFFKASLTQASSAANLKLLGIIKALKVKLVNNFRNSNRNIDRNKLQAAYLIDLLLHKYGNEHWNTSRKEDIIEEAIDVVGESIGEIIKTSLQAHTFSKVVVPLGLQAGVDADEFNKDLFDLKMRRLDKKSFHGYPVWAVVNKIGQKVNGESFYGLEPSEATAAHFIVQLLKREGKFDTLKEKYSTLYKALLLKKGYITAQRSNFFKLDDIKDARFVAVLSSLATKSLADDLENLLGENYIDRIVDNTDLSTEYESKNIIRNKKLDITSPSIEDYNAYFATLSNDLVNESIERHLVSSTMSARGEIAVLKLLEELKYDPTEAYKRGYAFYHGFPGYSGRDPTPGNIKDFVNEIVFLTNNGFVTPLSTYTEKVNPALSHERDWHVLGGKKQNIRIKIFPSSEDIKLSGNRDIYSGQRTTIALSKTFEEGWKEDVVKLKLPIFKLALSKGHGLEDSIANSIENREHNHNEQVIYIKKGTFKFEYDEELGPEIKAFLDEVNAKLGTVVEPSINHDYVDVSPYILGKMGVSPHLELPEDKKDTPLGRLLEKYGVKTVAELKKLLPGLPNSSKGIDIDSRLSEISKNITDEEIATYVATKRDEFANIAFGMIQTYRNTSVEDEVRVKKRDRKSRFLEELPSNNLSLFDAIGLPQILDYLDSTPIDDMPTIEGLRQYVNVTEPSAHPDILYGLDEEVELTEQAPEPKAIDEAKGIFYSLKPNSAIDFQLKAINILQSPKADEIFRKGDKNNWSIDKILNELQVPKEQQELIKSFNTRNREEIITSLLANYSYTIEISTAKEKLTPEYLNYNKDPFAGDEVIEVEKLTNYYANLTVPGGTNYTENEIATPAITPSIKGHAQFATDKGIGWFRSDDKAGSFYEDSSEIDLGGQKIQLEGGIRTTDKVDDTKTRRILEVQSDLFQKGRDKENLVNTQQDRNEVFNPKKAKEEINSSGNQFLQLLNKDNNWVTFFIKSIVQDSAKKGYEKVLFPTGNTASKVEGHTTLEEFKKQKEDRLKRINEQLARGEVKENFIIEKRNLYDIRNLRYTVKIENTKIGTYISTEFKTKEDAQKWIDDKNNPTYEVKIDLNEDELNIYKANLLEKEVLELELERVEREGFGALKPIFKFYEENVKNILEKNYNVKEIIDEYGNTWNEVTLDASKEGTIYFSINSPKENTLDRETVNKVKKLLARLGIKMDDSLEASLGINGVADLLNKIIKVVRGEIGENALPEEAMHFIVAAVKDKYPSLYAQMEKEIWKYKIYSETLAEYRDNPLYQKNGKPNLDKIKEEAIGKLLAGLVINEDLTDEGKLIDTSKKWWAKVLDAIRDLFNKVTDNPFEDPFDLVANKAFDDDFILPEDIKNLSQATSFLQLGTPAPDKQKALFDKLTDDMASGRYKKIQVPGDRHYEINGKKLFMSVTEYKKQIMEREHRFNERTESQKFRDAFSAEWGNAIDETLNHIMERFVDPTTGFLRTKPNERPKKSDGSFDVSATPIGKSEMSIRGLASPTMAKLQMYETLEGFVQEFLKTFPPNTRFMWQVIVADTNAKRVISGTIDFMAILEDASVKIYDWKSLDSEFFDVTIGKATLKEDVAWFKKKEYDIQIKEYRKMFTNSTSVYARHLDTPVPGRNPLRFKIDVTESRAIPIAVALVRKKLNPAIASWEGNTIYDLSKIQIGSPDWTNSWRILKPVPTTNERTQVKQLDALIDKIDKIYNDLFSKRYSTKKDREAKNRELNRLKEAKRDIQVNHHINSTLNSLILTLNRLNKELPNADFTLIRRNLSTLKTLDNLKKSLEDVFSTISADRKRVESALKTETDEAKKKLLEKQLQTIANSEEVYDKLGDVDTNINLLSEQYRKRNEEQIQILADKMGIHNIFSIQRQISIRTGEYWFNGKSETFIKVVQVFNKLLHEAHNRSKFEFKDIRDQLVKSRKEVRKWAEDHNMTMQEALYKMLTPKSGEGEDLKFLAKWKKDFYSARDQAIARLSGDDASVLEGVNWFIENMDFDKVAYKAEEKDKIDQINDEEFDVDPIKNAEARKLAIEEWKKKNNPFNDGVINKEGFNKNNRFLQPKSIWKTEEYQFLEANKPLYDAYQLFRNIVKNAEKNGQVERWLYTRAIPNMENFMALGLSDLPGRTAINLINSIYQEDAPMAKLDELGFPTNQITTKFTKDLGIWKERPVIEDGVKKVQKYKDYSNVSKDLFSVFLNFAESSITAQNLQNIEDASLLLYDYEYNKTETIPTTKFGYTIEDPQEGKLRKQKITPEVNKNAEFLHDFIMHDLYHVNVEHDTPLSKYNPSKFASKLIKKVNGGEEFLDRLKENTRYLSLKSLVLAINSFNQLRILAFNFRAAGANFVVGMTNVWFEAGKSYNFADTLPPTDVEEIRKFLALTDYVLPGIEFQYSTRSKDGTPQIMGTFSEIRKDYGTLAAIGQSDIQRLLYSLMRTTDTAVQYSVYLAMLRNSMIVDGKIVSIANYVKAMEFEIGGKKYTYADKLSLTGAVRDELEKKVDDKIQELKASSNLLKVAKISKDADNGVEIKFDGLDRNSSTVSDFRVQVQEVIKDVLGSITEEDTSMIRMSWVGNSYVNL